MIKISIIVPVYNTEKYLKKCLESLCNQSVDKKTYEIIVVNDGSPDDSERIIYLFQKKYEDLFKYIKKKNGGISSARNAGLKAATGKYIMFVDSDDYIDSDTLENFYKIEKNDDMYIYGYREIYDGSVKEVKINNSESKSVKDALPIFFENSAVRGYVWNKIFKREIIKKNMLKFDENIKHIEDLLFVMEYISKISNICLCSKTYYNYLQRNGSLVNSGFNMGKLTAFTSFNRIKEIVYNISPNYIPTIDYFIYELCYELSVRIRVGNNKKFNNEYISLKKDMRKYYKHFILKKVKIKYKIKASIKLICYNILIKKYGGTK